MKKKLLKIMALCLCTISLGVSLCSCGFLDRIYDVIDSVVDKGSSSEDSDSNEENSSSTGQSTSQKPNGGNSGSNNSIGDNGGNNSSTEDKNTPTEQQELKDPANVSQYIADGVNAVSGASIYLGEAEYFPSMRFTFTVTGAVKEVLDNDTNKSLSFILAPVTYFDSVNVNNYTYMDWVTALNDAEKTFIHTSVSENNFYASGDDYYVRLRLDNIMYKNTNRAFVCMMVLATKNGNTTSYQYSKLPDGLTYRSNARSLAYVASAALNANTLGLETFSEENVAKLEGLVNWSVDLANGLEEVTDDDSTYDFQIETTMHANMQVGEKFSIAVTITPEVNVPVWYRSLDESVATVNDNGVVTIVGTGTTVIRVYVAGKAKGVTVSIG